MIDNVDYALLKYVAQFDKPTKIRREDLPLELQIRFKTMGSDRDTIHGRLFELSKTDLVKSPYAGMWEIRPGGLLAIKQYEDIIPKPSFAEQCDKVLNFIVEGARKNIAYDANEISQHTGVDSDTVDDIAHEFAGRGFVKLTTTSGIYNFHTMPAASIFERKTSFVNEERIKKAGWSNIYHNSTHIEGDYTRNENNGDVQGDLIQGYHVTKTISREDEEKLKYFGVNASQIDELKEIIRTNDKKSLPDKLLKWLGPVATAVATKGLTEHLPALIDFIKHLG